MERRYYNRLPLELECLVFDKNTNKEYQGSLTDISEGGIGIYLGGVDEYPQEGSYCTVQFIGSFRGYDFIVSEVIQIINVSKVAGSIRLGGVFRKQLSDQCVHFIQLVSSDQFFNFNQLAY